MRNIDLDSLHIFKAVVDYGGITKAAAQLNRVQSNITTRVKNLEERLGVRLLARTTRSVTPTEAGERLLREARVILDRREHLLGVARSFEAHVEQRLVVAIDELYPESELGALFADFAQRFPHVELRTGVELTGIAQDEDGVTATLRDADGKPVETLDLTLRADAAGYVTFPSGIRQALPVSTANPVQVDGRFEIKSAATDIGLFAVEAGGPATGSISGTVEANPSAATVLVVAEVGGKGFTAIAGREMASICRVSSAAMVTGIRISTNTRVPTALARPTPAPDARPRPARASQRSTLAACSAVVTSRRTMVASRKPMKKISAAPTMLGMKVRKSDSIRFSGVTTPPRFSTWTRSPTLTSQPLSTLETRFARAWISA